MDEKEAQFELRVQGAACTLVNAVFAEMYGKFSVADLRDMFLEMYGAAVMREVIRRLELR